MSNGEFCCAIGLCCPPDSPTRRSALINELEHGISASATTADQGFGAIEAVADWLIANVDMLPKGTIDMTKVAASLKSQG